MSGHNLYVGFDVGICKSDVSQKKPAACGDEPLGRQQRLYSPRRCRAGAYQRADGRIAEGHCRTRRAYCAWCRGDLGRRGAALFLALEEGINLLPGFSPELQGYSDRCRWNSTFVRICFKVLPGTDTHIPSACENRARITVQRVANPPERERVCI